MTKLILWLIGRIEYWFVCVFLNGLKLWYDSPSKQKSSLYFIITEGERERDSCRDYCICETGFFFFPPCTWTAHVRLSTFHVTNSFPCLLCNRAFKASTGKVRVCLLMLMWGQTLQKIWGLYKHVYVAPTSVPFWGIAGFAGDSPPPCLSVLSNGWDTGKLHNSCRGGKASRARCLWVSVALHAQVRTPGRASRVLEQLQYILPSSRGWELLKLLL